MRLYDRHGCGIADGHRCRSHHAQQSPGADGVMIDMPSGLPPRGEPDGIGAESVEIGSESDLGDRA